MPDSYFSKFRSVNYGGRNITNVTERSAILNKIMANPYVFYPYDISIDERADQFADRYYNDPYMVWLIYMANGIIDPYFDWYMTDEEFRAFIVKKYGGYAEATKKVLFYRNNWYKEEGEIPISRYRSLDPKEYKYWEPVYGSGHSVRGYRRKKIDWVLNTNKIVRYSAAGTFKNDELLTIKIDPAHTGNGHVLSSNSTTVTVQHTEGTVVANSTVQISSNSYVMSAAGNTNITSSSVLVSNMEPVEEIYWDPVKAYDEEMTKNSGNRAIKVLDKGFAPQVLREFKKIMG